MVKTMVVRENKPLGLMSLRGGSRLMLEIESAKKEITGCCQNHALRLVVVVNHVKKMLFSTTRSPDNN